MKRYAELTRKRSVRNTYKKPYDNKLKDDKYMKKGLPLNLDPKNQVMIYEWLNDNKFYGDNIHIVKADLHSSNYSSCKRFDYRNVLSLFGASDYSSFNFSRNSYGCSYDLCINGNLVRGEIQNM